MESDLFSQFDLIRSGKRRLDSGNISALMIYMLRHGKDVEFSFWSDRFNIPAWTGNTVLFIFVRAALFLSSVLYNGDRHYSKRLIHKGIKKY